MQELRSVVKASGTDMQELQSPVEEIAEAMARLLHVVEMHQRRLDRLEDKGFQE